MLCLIDPPASIHSKCPPLQKSVVQPGSESKDISEFRFFAIQNIRPRARGNGGEEWSFEKQASQVPFQFGR